VLTVPEAFQIAPPAGPQCENEVERTGKGEAMATEQRTEQQGDGSVATASEDKLTITDKRTGQTYELEVTDGTIRAMDLRQIKVSEDDFGLMAYDPAFTNTASCRSAITFIDGEAGILQHRGYPIEQLSEHSSYLEVAYLLTFGELPTQPQLERWMFDVTHHTFVHEDIKQFLQGFRYDAHPMGMLLAGVGALSTFYPDAKQIDDPEERYMAAIRMIAKVPTLAAFAYRHNMGLPYVYPDNDLSYPGNFLSMMFKKTEAKYEPDPRLERALDVLFILHADHEQNCSTNAVRGVGSSQVDPYSAVAAGVAALYGPLHGGANEAVLRMLRRIETPENIPDFLEGVKKREERLMGFGHRVYKNYDPRARIIEQHMDEVFEATEYNPLVEIARELEKRALDDEYFTSRKLYPNVDYYSGIIYEALQIPTEMFTVIFAIPRTSGWVAQWMELNDDPEQKIARPRQIYTGERDRDYVAVEDRTGPEKITGPPARRPKRQRRGA
jgi:citrate synthase